MGTSVFGRKLTLKERIALQIVFFVSWLSFLGLPYGVVSISERFGTNEAQGSYIAAAELIAVAMAAIISGRNIHLRDKRRFAVAGMAISLFGALVALVAPELTWAVVGRISIGIGVGIITAVTNAIPGMFENAEKTFARMTLWMSIGFAILMFLAPAAMEQLGAIGFNYLEILILLLISLVVFFLPRARLSPVDCVHGSVKRVRGKLLPSGVVPVFLAIFLLYVSQGLAWTFAGSLAQELNVSSSAQSIAFTMCALGNLPAALLAERLGLRYRFTVPVVVALIGLGVAYAGIYCSGTSTVYLLSIGVFSSFSAFVLPYMQGLLSELDTTGASAASGGAIINIGGAAGPAIGGLIFGGIGYGGIGWICAALSIGSAFCFALSSTRKLAAQPVIISHA